MQQAALLSVFRQYAEVLGCCTGIKEWTLLEVLGQRRWLRLELDAELVGDYAPARRLLALVSLSPAVAVRATSFSCSMLRRLAVGGLLVLLLLGSLAL